MSRSRNPVDRPETPPGWWNARSALLDRHGERLLEHDEPAAGGALVGDVEQLLLGCLHLHLAVHLGVGAKGVVDHFLANINQLAAQPGIVNGAAILPGVDDADHRGQQLAQIGSSAHLIQHAAMFELRPQRDGIRQLSATHPAVDRGEDAAVDRIGEMVRRQELCHPVIRAVVGEKGAEQRLLRLNVGGGQPLGQAEQGGVDAVHVGCNCSLAAPTLHAFSLWMAVEQGDGLLVGILPRHFRHTLRLRDVVPG